MLTLASDFVADPCIGHRLFVAGACFFAAAWRKAQERFVILNSSIERTKLRDSFIDQAEHIVL
jgi:hypothetical protein